MRGSEQKTEEMTETSVSKSLKKCSRLRPESDDIQQMATKAPFNRVSEVSQKRSNNNNAPLRWPGVCREFRCPQRPRRLGTCRKVHCRSEDRTMHSRPGKKKEISFPGRLRGNSLFREDSLYLSPRKGSPDWATLGLLCCSIGLLCCSPSCDHCLRG